MNPHGLRSLGEILFQANRDQSFDSSFTFQRNAEIARTRYSSVKSSRKPKLAGQRSGSASYIARGISRRMRAPLGSHAPTSRRILRARSGAPGARKFIAT